MNEKNNCKIVQDLLPNYMEGLTDKETNEFIEQHLKKCKDCKKVYESLKEKPKNLEISENGKKVDYFKKYKRIEGKGKNKRGKRASADRSNN